MNGAQSESIKLRFLGIPNVKFLYRGDDLFCDTRKPSTCLVEVPGWKAAQLIQDSPEQWEVMEPDADEVRGNLLGQNWKKVAKVSATQSIRIIDSSGKVHQVAPGSTVEVSQPSQGQVEVANAPAPDGTKSDQPYVSESKLNGMNKTKLKKFAAKNFDLILDPQHLSKDNMIALILEAAE